MKDFTEFYSLNRKKFTHKLLYYTKSYDVAEDVVQDAFIKALDKFPQYDPTKGSLKAWFTKVLFSTLWNHIREQRKRPFTFDIDDLLATDLLAYEEVPHLATHLNELDINPKHRQVLIASMVIGYTNAEISRVLGVSEDNIRKILQRFRKEEEEG